jgi:hypothetical protein
MAELNLRRFAASRCNLLQLAAICCNWLQLRATDLMV